jgi:hypothetical protein
MSFVLSKFLNVPEINLWGYNILKEISMLPFRENTKIGEVYFVSYI